MRISSVESTELFAEGPRQIVRVTLEESDGPTEVVITGPGVQGVGQAPEIPVTCAARPGEVVPITVVAADATAEAELVVAEPGWTVWMIPHFHYDPVWWNTQAAYTETWAASPTPGPRMDFQHAGFELVRLHLETARREPDYKFVLAEVDYLKPYWDAHPEDRAFLRKLLGEGRIEIMGGTYNEPNTNLTSAESTIRNLVHGIGFQRDILGGDPRTAWQLDAFGHDPQFPGMAADAGLTSSSWARGPFHQWGPMLGGGDPTRMQFPAEFEWVSPSGRGVLTHYMPGHYSAGWWMDQSATLEEAEAAVHQWFRALKRVAATRNVLLPVGTDYSPPNKWIMDIQRSWNARYVSPRFVCGLPREFFAAVRAEGPVLTAQTRDMNPVYTGKDVSYIDTKQAQRHAEAQLVDAEMFATIAALDKGAPYPHAALDKAWRQLVYGAHHDAITGSEGDQVYLDLLPGWRETYDLGAGVLTAALERLGEDLGGVIVWNPSSWPRTDLARIRLRLDPGIRGFAENVLLENPARHPDGSLAEVDLVFLATDVPPLGYRTFHFTPSAEAQVGWADAPGTRIASATHEIEVDPARGGGVTSLRVDGRELLQPGRIGNELLVYDEYPAHPSFHEGPWHLVPKGTVSGSGDTEAEVSVSECPIGRRITVKGRVGPVAYTQEITLWDGLARVDLATHVEDFDGADALLRVRWPVAIPGGLPVSEVGDAVIGRGFGLIDVDSGEHPWTLDNPAYTWFALSSTVRIRTPRHTRAIGVAEIIGHSRELAVALVRQGVTATTSTGDGPRYGHLDVDSNLPDVRIAIGPPAENPFTARLLGDSPLASQERLRAWIPAETALEKAWTPSADLRGTRALPVLVVWGPGELEALIDDLGDAVVEVGEVVGPEPDGTFDDYTAALVNRGIPGFAVDPSGALHLSLMRSCTGWPSGIWIDPPRRTAPDGSNFQLQHWSHTFEYALVAGPGDWRAAGLVRHGHGVNHPLHATQGTGGGAGGRSYLSVSHGVVAALKARGNPLASGREPGEAEGVTLRVYEPHGVGGEIEVITALPVDDWQRADLLERPVPGAGLGGMEIATLVAGVPAFGVARTPEPHQPVYTRYWLHNTGPAPLGGLPVAVHLSHADVELDGPGEVGVTVASSLTAAEASGVVTLVAPEGWAVEPAVRPFVLPPGGHAAFPVRLTPPGDAPQGVYWLRARVEHDGQAFEDVTRLHVGGRHDPGLVVAQPSPVRLRPGERGEIVVGVESGALTPVAVQAQLISPWQTYALFPDWNTGAEVPARGAAELRFPVRVPPGARPGRWWAVVKLGCAGWLHYTETVSVEVLP
ncbi:glycoside hydrolase [Streptosporangiaceae bacterium NEAU-GS5]|nr:glycoside hydrolase [Streptosporangiaceae bacterium NEAU-GS5]